jgi:hypothetical protein
MLSSIPACSLPYLLLYKISHHLFFWDNGWLITNYCLHSMKDIIKFSFCILLIYPTLKWGRWMEFFLLFLLLCQVWKVMRKTNKNLSRVRKYFQNYTNSSRVVVKIWKFYSIKNMVCSMNWIFIAHVVLDFFFGFAFLKYWLFKNLLANTQF